MTDGLIFDIQRFSVHDGPGVRTTFFLKGCPLRCGWCHNPEGLEGRVQLQFLAENCILCGDCRDACLRNVHDFEEETHRVDFSRCDTCGKCVESCPSGALRLAGQRISPKEAVQAALRDQPFYGKTGGVTFSGGECSMQPEFLLETLALCKEAGLHTAVDTCGLMPEETLRKLMKLADLFLYDIKAATPEVHKGGTGADNTAILQNYRLLMEEGCRVWVRVPVIGGFNASETEMGKIATFLKEHPGVEQIELMPYHKLGTGKYPQIGRPKPDDSCRMVSHNQMKEYFQQFQSLGLPVQGAERTE